MRKLIVTVTILCVALGGVSAETLLEKVDRMHDEDQHIENAVLIQDAIASTQAADQKAELYCRLARATMEIGDQLEQDGADEGELLETFKEAEGYSDKSIELNPDSYWGYYWKSANIGRWGETKGILNSLFKARSMRGILEHALEIYPEHPSSFYVLGIMHRKVPGRPISFGSSNKAVSLGRKALDAQRVEIESGLEDEIKFVFYIELARSLEDRGWNASKRRKQQQKMAESYRKERNVQDKNFFYEGIVDIPDISDEEEAIEMMRWAISELEKKPMLKNSERVDLAEAVADLADWTD